MRSPLGDVEVTVYDANDTAVAFGFTDFSDGSYTVGGLETGTYHVGFTSFSGQLLPQYFDGEPTLAKADPVTVTAGTTAPASTPTWSPGRRPRSPGR